MTATVHTHHARTHRIPLADWCGDRTDQFVMWAKRGDEETTLRHLVWGWLLRHHLYGIVVTAVALLFVSGLVFGLAGGDDFWAVLVALIGYPAIAASVAYHWGDAA